MKLFFVFPLIVSIPLLVFSRLEAMQGGHYSVQPGDTWYGIGKKLQIPHETLATWNQKQISDPLRPGDLLKIQSSLTPAEPIKPKEPTLKNRPAFPLLQKEKLVRTFTEDSTEPHKGLLFSAEKELVVVSSLPGKVVSIDYMDGYSNYVILEHEEGIYTVYGNLEKVTVLEGQRVSEKDRLGNTSKKRGLYFQVNKGKSPVNPLTFLEKGL